MFLTLSAWSTSSIFRRVRRPWRMNLSDSCQTGRRQPTCFPAENISRFYLNDFAQPVLNIGGQRC